MPLQVLNKRKMLVANQDNPAGLIIDLHQKIEIFTKLQRSIRPLL
jgi:hypothetical protein